MGGVKTNYLNRLDSIWHWISSNESSTQQSTLLCFVKCFVQPSIDLLSTCYDLNNNFIFIITQKGMFFLFPFSPLLYQNLFYEKWFFSAATTIDGSSFFYSYPVTFSIELKLKLFSSKWWMRIIIEMNRLERTELHFKGREKRCWKMNRIEFSSISFIWCKCNETFLWSIQCYYLQFQLFFEMD